MAIDSQQLKKAFDLWNEFKEKLLYESRFIVKHEVLDYIKNLAEKNQRTIEKDRILYRARLYTEDIKILQDLNKTSNDEKTSKLRQLVQAQQMGDKLLINESGFWGYNTRDSFVLTDNNLIKDGRANPSYIKYLYTAEDPYTAMVEIRPFLGSKVSIAEIKVIETLNIADFSYDSFEKFDGFEQYLIYLIMSDFSEPINSDRKSYIPTQYIAEFVKTLEFNGVKFDGIKFNSSLHKSGRNITIFNYNKCEPIGSKLYEIEDICFEAKCIAPENEKPLVHRKLVLPRLNPFGVINQLK